MPFNFTKSLNKMCIQRSLCFRTKPGNTKCNQETNNNMSISTSLSITTINVNELNAPVKRCLMANGIKIRPIYTLLTRDSL